MTREEATGFLIDMSYKLGNMSVEYLSERDGEKMREAIKALEQEPRWISVTEDAPPKGIICLWCNKQGSVFISAITYRSKNNSYVGKHGYFSNGLENYGDIIAWMPLPQPYREVEE